MTYNRNRFEKMAGVTLGNMLSGASLGLTGGLLLSQLASSKERENAVNILTKQDLVDSVSATNEMQPGLRTILKEGDNAFYDPMTDSVITPEKINKYFLGHEIGHRNLEKSEGAYSPLKEMLSRIFYAKGHEAKAWDASPLAGDDKHEEAKRSALAVRDAGQRSILTGLLLGALAPSAYDAFKYAIRS